MFKFKFSKNSIVSISFLLAALLISLLLGSFNFLKINSTATLPHIVENLDNMDSIDIAAPPSAAPAPAAMPSFSKPKSTNDNAAAPAPVTTQEDLAKILNINGNELKHLLK